MTQKTANILASGLVEGSLKPNSPNYISNLENVALATIDAAAALSKTDPKIKKEDVQHVIDAWKQVGVLNSTDSFSIERILLKHGLKSLWDYV